MDLVKRLVCFFFLSCFAFSPAAISAKKEPLTSVADLRYGVALYHYYQSEYLEALAELLVAKERGGIKGHGESPAVMEGGFALGYGMEIYATQIFENLLQQDRSQKSKDAAWFYLGRLRYLRNEFERTHEALDRISKKPYSAIREEIDVLRINLAIKTEQLEQAEKLAKRANFTEQWQPYVDYNLGAAHARAQNFEKSLRYFKRLTKTEYREEEHQALYDKAMTASGYSHLFNKNYEEAIDHFSRVRLTGTLSNKALLGYGWAAAEMKDYKEALKPWMHLSKSTLIDENALEALVAVPYAYDQLGMEALALERFQEAERNFGEEIKRLDTVAGNLEGEAILDALNIESSEGIDWLAYAEKNNLSPQLAYLTYLFSKEEFQKSVQELRDLLAVQEMLGAWDEKLEFYTETTLKRQSGRRSSAQIVEAQTLARAIAEIQNKRNALSDKLDAVEAKQDYFALANEQENDLIRRVLRSREHAVYLRATDPLVEDADESLRRYYGLLYWDASENASERLWRAKKSLIALDNTIKALKRSYRNIGRVIQNAPDIAPYLERLENGRSEIRQQLQLTDGAVLRSTDALRDRIKTALAEQRGRLHHYMAQARLSIARIYDKARIEEMEKQGLNEEQIREKNREELNARRDQESKAQDAEAKEEAQ